MLVSATETAQTVTRPLPAAFLILLALLACGSRRVDFPPSADATPQALAKENDRLRKALAEQTARADALEAKLKIADQDAARNRKELSRSRNADKAVLLDRVNSLERLLAERERVVEAKSEEAYLRGRTEMAAYLVDHLEIRGETSSRERFLGADHFYSFEIWFDKRRIVKIPVQTKRAEDPRSMVLSTALSAATALAGI